MADGRVIIDTSMDTSSVDRQVAQVNQSLNRIGETIPQQAGKMTDEFGNRFDSMGRRIREVYKGTSVEAQRMSSEMRSAFAQQRNSMNGFRDDMIKVQYGYFQMAQGAKDFQGTNQEFMAGIEDMGKRHKKVMDNMVAANDMQRMNFYQSVGAMLARSTQASKISDNFTRMGNPLYSVNNGLLNVADGMNKIAMRGQPAALALKMLGPSANMKQLQDMTMMISQGLMRFTGVALIAAVGAGMFYKAIHDGAMESNAAYAEAFSGMLASVKQAFEPMIDVFAAVMTPVWNFIGAIAEMVVRFNEANPMLAKVIAGFLLLIPALTLILSPLAIGIGLFGGLSAAMGAVWMIIGPIVTGFAAMMGTVLLVAAVIVGLAAAFYLLWTRSETFRSGVIAGWNAIKAAAIAVFNYIKPYILQAMLAVKTAIQTALNAIRTFWSENGAQIMTIVRAFMGVVRTIFQTYLANIVAVAKAGFNVLTVVVKVAFQLIKTIISTVMKVVGALVKTILAVMRGDWQAALNGIKTIVSTIFNGIRSVISTVMNGIRALISSVWSGIKSVTSSSVNGIRSIVTSVFNGLKSTVSGAMNGVKTAIVNGWNNAKSFLTSINLASIGRNIIDGLIGGITSKIAAVGKAIGGIADKIKGGIAKAMDVNSPSRWMRDKIGKMLPAGISVGVLKNLKPLDQATKAMAQRIKAGATTQTARVAAQPTTQNINRGVTQNVTINSPSPLSPAEIARQNQRVAQNLGLQMGW